MFISSNSLSTINDTRVGLKNFLSVMKTAEPTKSNIGEYLSAALNEAGVDVEFDILS
jgi:hypothetical protein